MTAVELLKEMFEHLNPAELEQIADDIIGSASDSALQSEYTYREYVKPRNFAEEWPGVAGFQR